MWEEYLEKILNPAHERIEKIYLEHGIEACDLFHFDDLEKVFSKKVYDAVEGKAYQKTIFENKFGNFVRHQGFWKKVHIIENDKLKYYNEWVFEKRHTQWFKDNYDEIMEEIKQRKYANGAGVEQRN